MSVILNVQYPYTVLIRFKTWQFLLFILELSCIYPYILQYLSCKYPTVIPSLIGHLFKKTTNSQTLAVHLRNFDAKSQYKIEIQKKMCQNYHSKGPLQKLEFLFFGFVLKLLDVSDLRNIPQQGVHAILPQGGRRVGRGKFLDFFNTLYVNGPGSTRLKNETLCIRIKGYCDFTHEGIHFSRLPN